MGAFHRLNCSKELTNYYRKDFNTYSLLQISTKLKGNLPMRKITIFYDRTRYTLIWIKPLIWAQFELKKRGVTLEFCSAKEYFPQSRVLNNDQFSYESQLEIARHNQFDICLLAYHLNSKFIGNKKTQIIELINELRKRSNHLIWCDTSDSAGTVAGDILHLVDIYFKKQVYVKRELYLNSYYQNRYYAEYYHNEYGISDEMSNEVENCKVQLEDLKKIKVSWNYGLADFWNSKVCSIVCRRQLKNVIKSKPSTTRKYDCHFRGTAKNTSITYQRVLTNNFLINNSEKFTVPNIEKDVNHANYLRELKNSFSVISPFGYGEICQRDFEAFTYGNLLLKPDVEYIESFPNWYIKYETYVPVKWNFEDLCDIVEDIQRDRNKYIDIAKNGQERFLHYRNGKIGKELFSEHLIEALSGITSIKEVL